MKKIISAYLGMFAMLYLASSGKARPAAPGPSIGTVVGWGDNSGGAIAPPAGLKGVVAIAAGFSHSLALKRDGTVIGWGDNSYNQSTPPPGLNGVVAICAGWSHSLALKNDGTIVGWGNGYEGATTPPAGLKDVVAIAAGDADTFALKNDGTVVAWGYNSFGQTTPPGGLRGVVAISASYYYCLALKSDGTVVGWGDDRNGQCDPPSGLSNIVAISAGHLHGLALKNDGTVVGWGDNEYGEITPPSGLSGVVAIAAGDEHSVALKNDGTVVAWGYNSSGQSTAPAGLTGVSGIAAAELFTLALVGPPKGPAILSQPGSFTALNGGAVTFGVFANGWYPLNYQWRFNCEPIPGSSNLPTLTLNSVTAANSGAYSVVVSDGYGSVSSSPGWLSVLADGANGNQPAQVIPSECPLPQSGVDSLVLITHGWEPLYHTGGKLIYEDISWMTTMSNAIATNNNVQPNWEVRTLDWTQISQVALPQLALDAGTINGLIYGMELSQQPWKKVHLIGHSAGAAVIDAIATGLQFSPNPPEIQETFLDPYTGPSLDGRLYYGNSACWADDYFVVDTLTDYGGILLGNLPDSTSGQLEWAHNVNVGATLSSAISLPAYSSGIAGSTPAYVNPSLSHGAPIDFYMSTINGTASPCVGMYGFPLSLEAGGSGNWASFPRNNSPVSLCAGLSVSQGRQPLRIDSTLNFLQLPGATSGTGGSFQGAGAALSADDPSWVAVAVTITNAVNFIQFDAEFTDMNYSDGLLTAYWNTNQIGMVDERVAFGGVQTYQFSLPSQITSGVYTLSFRLDAFSGATGINITNVTTAFIGLTDPISLQIQQSSSDLPPTIQLTAPAGYTYLVQSSTNLSDWWRAAFLVNTNGTVLFADPNWTNSSAQFYRAILP